MHVYSPVARNFLLARCLLPVPVFTQSVLFVTLESSLTTISAPQRTCGERRIVSRCFAALRHQLRHLRVYVTDDCFRSLVASLIHSRLDYGNFVLVGLYTGLYAATSTMLNAAARLVFPTCHYDLIKDALATLH